MKPGDDASKISRTERMKLSSDRFVHHEYQHSKIRKARRFARLHRYQWALRKTLADARERKALES